jgi:murein DD-endopeptidase MepM/ murein hydrolase activator NlpD
MRRLVVVLLLLVVIGLLLTRAEPFAPTFTLEVPVDVVGRTTQLRFVLRDRGSGLAGYEVRIVPADGAPAVIAHEEFPRISFRGSGVNEKVVSTYIDAVPAGLKEGPATFEVWARDHSLLSKFRSGPLYSQPITIDLTPPALEALTSQHIIRLGGSECAIYRAGADAVRSGVQVGAEFFAGIPGVFADPTLRVALFAVPEKAPNARPVLIADDQVGNQRAIGLENEVRPQQFAKKTLPLSEEFLAAKVPELLQENGMPPARDLVEGYLRINRDLRLTTESRLRQICRDPTPRQLWEGAFLRLPNSAPLSGFADRRTYTYNGQPIDQQTHLGFDLASLRRSPVPAANNGRVAFVGSLGIYGNTVVLDHGLGVYSLYGHLSEMTVSAGQDVKRGDIVGKTGETGLAGGDHLHFSTMIRGVHVDPVEWWDAHWIHDHIEARLAAYPLAGAAPAEATP